MPRLNIILTEAFLSVYLATLAYGLTTANAKILHRLAARQLTASLWGAVFGGGLKTAQRPAPMRIGGSGGGSGGGPGSGPTNPSVLIPSGSSPRRQQQAAAAGIPRVTDEMSKHRVRLYMNTVQGGAPPPPVPPPPAVPPPPQQQQQPMMPSPSLQVLCRVYSMAI